VSVLIEYGLAENIVDALVGAGIGSIEKLGSMTPEQLEEIQGIGPGTIEQLQDSVNAYYNQFEDNQGIENPEQNLPEATPAAADMSASAEELAETQGTDTESLETEPGPAGVSEEMTETNYPPGTLYDAESPEERFEPGSAAEEAETEAGEQAAEDAHSATIENAGFPTDNSAEGEGPEGEVAADETADAGTDHKRG
jgi:N utilization substance protein A